ncbi:MAG: hypothetical protein GY929_18945 [Actinomycetia bacterium]|nr:hypothetical protein [Actinomycetes bacterium]
MTISRRRALYYILFIMGAVIIHQPIARDLLGGSAVRFLRRQSEAYALLVLVPAYWDLFAPRADPRSRSAAMSRTPTSARPQLLWFGALLAASVLLGAGSFLPQSLITMKEAVVAALVITAYLGWSRGLLPWSTRWAQGGALVGSRVQVVYYVAVVVVAVLSYQSFTADIIGDPVSTWLRDNSEAWVALVTIPLYFDVIAQRREPNIHLAWYLALGAAALAIQADAWPGAFDSFIAWGQQTTEAWIAAIVIAGYFDFWRGPTTIYEPAIGRATEPV